MKEEGKRKKGKVVNRPRVRARGLDVDGVYSCECSSLRPRARTREGDSGRIRRRLLRREGRRRGMRYGSVAAQVRAGSEARSGGHPGARKFTSRKNHETPENKARHLLSHASTSRQKPRLRGLGWRGCAAAERFRGDGAPSASRSKGEPQMKQIRTARQFRNGVGRCYPGGRTPLPQG